MEVVMIYDMRAPSFGAPRAEIFSAALEMAEWADRIGVDVIGLGEHHNSDDGYNPSPLIWASALAARTKRIRLRSAVLLASCYDPVRLAEDIAMLQIISNGRYELGLGFGYRRVEFEMYGRRVEDRFDHTVEVAKLLKQAWSGEAFTYRDRPVQISPLPRKQVPIMLGGKAPKTARAAAEIADGFVVPTFGEPIWPHYREACLKLGHRDPGDYPKQGPTFLWVSEDPDRDWDWIAPHALHVLDSYGRWQAEANYKQKSAYTAPGLNADTIRQSHAYQVLTPDQTLRLIAELGDNSSLYLSPLFAGIDPKKGWEMLRLYEREVHPHVPRGIVPTWRHKYP